MPWLGAIIGSAAGSAARRRLSANGPVALITTLARASISSPVSSVAEADAIHEAIAVLRHGRDLGVVEQRRALFAGGRHQVDQQAGVVELAVEVDHPAFQAFRLDGGQALQRFLARENARSAEAILAGQQIVELQPDAIERRFPPIVIGHHEAQIAHQVRSVLQQQAALLQRFHHQREVALLQVAHAAVHQLGAAAGSAFAEIALLQQQDVVAAAGGIDRDARAGGAAAHDDHVPRAGVRAQPAVHLDRVIPSIIASLAPIRAANVRERLLRSPGCAVVAILPDARPLSVVGRALACLDRPQAVDFNWRMR